MQKDVMQRINFNQQNFLKEKNPKNGNLAVTLFSH